MVGTRSTIDAAFAAAGIEAHIGIEAGDPSVLAELAVGGLGVALVPEPYALARVGKLCVLPITDVQLRGSLALAWNNAREPTPSARRLIDYARQSLSAEYDLSG